MLVLGGLLATGGLVAVAARQLRPFGTEVGLTPVVRAAMAEPAPTGGNPEGDVTLAVFTDYNCPACRLAHPEMIAAVKADGAVRLKYMDWPIFGEDSRAAARAAIAADAQGLYAKVHAALMQGGRADADAARAALVAAGGDADLLRSELLDAGSRIDGQLSRFALHAFALGLGGTPGHLIGTVLLKGAADTRAFRRAIDRARKAASVATPR
jgi:protein-disulfide isomerase